MAAYYPYDNQEPHRRYRSKAEAMIASFLDERRLSYEYEKPTAVVDDRGAVRIWYPDFTLLEYGVLVEYFGVVDDCDYDRGIEKRIEVYRRNGYPLIDLYPSTLKENWRGYLLSSVDNVLVSRLSRYRASMNSPKGQQDAAPRAMKSGRSYRPGRPGAYRR